MLHWLMLSISTFQKVLYAVAILLLLNPLTYFFNLAYTSPSPDSAAYIALAEKILDTGLLYLHGWGHADTGLILPPIYPLFIALGDNFTDIAVVAKWVSSLSLLLSIIPLFILTKRLTNYLTAFIVVLVIQWNYLYIYYGTAMLSESIFLLFLSVAFLLLEQIIKNPSTKLSIMLGVVACCLFLTRQIGFFFIITLIPFLIFLHLKKPDMYKSNIVIPCVLGFLVLFLPYSYALHQQTLKSPFTQYYRMNSYVVSSEKLEQQEVKSDSYSELIRQRRESRQLLPDSSEMYSRLVHKNIKKPFLDRLSFNQIFKNLYNNISHVNKVLGPYLTLLFFISILSAIFHFFTRNDLKRVIIPLFITSYILMVSILTGLIERYMHVILPFIFIQIIAELYYYLKGCSIKMLGTKYLYPLGILVLLICLGYLFPHWLINTTFRPLQKISNDPLYGCKKLIKSGEPIFSIHPGMALTLGGTYRTLPNDNFRKVVKYAQNTNVKWLILASTPADIGERGLYSHSDWLQQGIGFEKDYSDIVKLRCLAKSSSGENISALYEFIADENIDDTGKSGI